MICCDIATTEINEGEKTDEIIFQCCKAEPYKG